MAGPWEQYQQKVPSGDGPWSKYASEPKPKSEAGYTFGESAANAATLGYLPEIQAAVEPVAFKVLDKLTGGNVSETRNKNFAGRRDEYALDQQKRAQENPKAAIAGTLAGGALMSPLIPVAAAPTALGRAGQAAKTGAILGALSAPAQTEGEYDPIQLGSRLKNAAVGGAIGGAVQGGFDAAAAIARKLAPMVSSKAELQAANAAGFTNKDFEKAGERVQDYGRYLLDEGIVTPLSTPGKIADRLDSNLESTGKEIGRLLRNAQDEISVRTQNGTAPITGFKKTGEISMTPIEVEKSLGVPTRVKVGKKPEVVASTIEPRSGYSIDAEKIASELRNNPVIREIERTPGREAASSRIEQALNTLSKRGEMTLPEALEVKQGLDKSIRYSKKDFTGAEEGFFEARQAVRDKMNDVVNKLEIADKDALVDTNRKYNAISTLQDVAERRAARDASKRTISLTDTLAGLQGVAAGTTPVEKAVFSALSTGANKFARTFGGSLQATALNAAAKNLAKIPAIAELAASNPSALQGVVNAMTAKFSGRGDTSESSFDPGVLDFFQKNPQLLENIQDSKIRAQIEKKIGRSPSQDSAIQRRLKQSR